MQDKVVSIYGYGRFGKLWADILSEDFKVKVYSRRGLKEDEVSKNIHVSDKKDIFDCDIMFFCVAISSLEQLLIDNKEYLKKETIFIDTCSVKVYPVEWMLKHLPPESQVIGSHPMFGPDSYKNGQELTVVLCDARSNNDTFKFWAEYFRNKKMRVEIMTPDEHDKTVAYSQGITHYIGRVLADLELNKTPIDTLGYQKLLDIIQQTCNDNIQLFYDLQKYNPHTKKMREDLSGSLQKIYSVLMSL